MQTRKNNLKLARERFLKEAAQARAEAAEREEKRLSRLAGWKLRQERKAALLETIRSEQTSMRDVQPLPIDSPAPTLSSEPRAEAPTLPIPEFAPKVPIEELLQDDK